MAKYIDLKDKKKIEKINDIIRPTTGIVEGIKYKLKEEDMPDTEVIKMLKTIMDTLSSLDQRLFSLEKRMSSLENKFELFKKENDARWEHQEAFNRNVILKNNLEV